MKKTLKFALVQSIPVMVGYLFLGFAFGLSLQSAGYTFIWAFYSSVIVYAGSMQFVLVSFLQNGISLVSAAVMTLVINSRHMFYGLSFIDRYKKMGKAYPYMIFSLTDETYSLLCGIKPAEGVHMNNAMFIISLFNQIYWITGSVVGAVAGEILPFNSSGVDFSMTALFVVIFVEQWLSSKSHTPVYIAVICGILSLLIFGSDAFLLPALIVTVFILMMNRRRLEPKFLIEGGGDTQ